MSGEMCCCDNKPCLMLLSAIHTVFYITLVFLESTNISTTSFAPTWIRVALAISGFALGITLFLGLKLDITGMLKLTKYIAVILFLAETVLFHWYNYGVRNYREVDEDINTGVFEMYGYFVQFSISSAG